MRVLLESALEKILRETGYDLNPYFTSLRNGSFEKEDFLETQVRFFHAVEYFNRPMAALCAKIPDFELRMPIARNVWEEHGNGDAQKSHAHTFQVFLQRLSGDVTMNPRSKIIPPPEVEAFNQSLMETCSSDDYLVGASRLGVIERMFSDISRWIGRGVVERGWMPADQMIHYNLHEELDSQHAQEFFNILEPAWNESEENCRKIEFNLRAGAILFHELYKTLYHSRKSRQSP